MLGSHADVELRPDQGLTVETAAPTESAYGWGSIPIMNA